MNYTQLKAAIIAYTENQDASFEAEIPVFGKQAEQRIYNSVQFPSLRKNVTGNVTATNKFLACPNDFLAPYSLAVIDALGAYEYLLNKNVNFIRQAPAHRPSSHSGRRQNRDHRLRTARDALSLGSLVATFLHAAVLPLGGCGHFPL